MSITAQKILDVLRAAPGGLTTKEVSEKLGVGAYDAAGRLSKLAAYGKIERIKNTLPSEKGKWRFR
jgi:predicted transcriptional regulator